MKFSYSKVEDYCNDMHSVAENLKEIFENIKNDSKNIGNGNWDGESSKNFCKRLNDVASNFDEIIREMEMAILFMANTSEGYQKIDEKLISEICNNLNITEPNYSFSKIFPW